MEEKYFNKEATKWKLTNNLNGTIWVWKYRISNMIAFNSYEITRKDLLPDMKSFEVLK